MFDTPTWRHASSHMKNNVLATPGTPTLVVTEQGARGSRVAPYCRGHHTIEVREVLRRRVIGWGSTVCFLRKAHRKAGKIFCSNINTADGGTFLEKLARGKSLFLWSAQLPLNQTAVIILRVSTKNQGLCQGPERHREATKKENSCFSLFLLGKKEKRFLFTR